MSRGFYHILTLALVALLLLSGCGGSGTGGVAQDTSLPAYMRQGFETYHETGGVARPANAIDVYIVYSPESQQYMPKIIAEFNRLSAEGKSPLTGQPYGQDERPIYVRGQQPTSGSSGSVAQGIVNAFIAPDNSSVYHPTIYQPSVSHWLALVNEQTGRQVFNLADAQPTALAPVVIAIWESRFEALRRTTGSSDIGWDDLLGVLNSPNGWQDYGIPDGRRAVYYGHTDPNVSSTGLSTTIAEFYACARKNGFTERRLTLAAVNSAAVQDCVRRIEQLVRHYSSRTEDFLEYISRGPDYLDMIALEETDLICLNMGAIQGDQVCAKPQERLVAIYPEEGTFWHEHPFGILDPAVATWVTPEQVEAARIFTEFVLTPPMQRIIMIEGFMRPANPNVPLEYPFVPENGVDINQPRTVLDVPDTSVIAAIQQNWTGVKRQADIMLVVDVSGSMSDQGKMDQARAALPALLNSLDPTTRVGLLSFSDRVTVWNPLALLENNRPALLVYTTCQNAAGYEPPRNSLYGRCLMPGGSTSLFTAVRTAVDILDATSNPERIRAVVVLSDGQDTCEAEGCSTLEAVISKIEHTRATVNPVLVIPIAYGSDADISALNSIARASATEVQAGDPENINEVLELIGSFF